MRELASREKLGAMAPFTIIGLEEVGTMIVEADLPDEVMPPFRQQALTILLGR